MENIKFTHIIIARELVPNYHSESGEIKTEELQYFHSCDSKSFAVERASEIALAATRETICEIYEIGEKVSTVTRSVTVLDEPIKKRVDRRIKPVPRNSGI